MWRNFRCWHVLFFLRVTLFFYFFYFFSNNFALGGVGLFGINMMLDIDWKFLAFGFSRLSFSLFTFSFSRFHFHVFIFTYGLQISVSISELFGKT
jgi:hypothetical protein